MRFTTSYLVIYCILGFRFILWKSLSREDPQSKSFNDRSIVLIMHFHSLSHLLSESSLKICKCRLWCQLNLSP